VFSPSHRSQRPFFHTFLEFRPFFRPSLVFSRCFRRPTPQNSQFLQIFLRDFDPRKPTNGNKITLQPPILSSFTTYNTKSTPFIPLVLTYTLRGFFHFLCREFLRGSLPRGCRFGWGVGAFLSFFDMQTSLSPANFGGFFGVSWSLFGGK
jgi:hypothetical protein